MKKDFNNSEYVSGRIYQHNLVKKTVQNKESKNFGTEFISGTVDIVTDEEGLNIIPIHYTYVTAVTSSGKANATYTVLDNIINGAKTWITDGKDAALKVRASTALALNDFYNREGELVSAKRNEGGFVTIVNKLSDASTRNTFEFDMLINGTRMVEADPERHIDADYLVVKGAIFDFRNAILPVELVVKNAGGIKYFENLDASPSNLIFTKVWGKIESQTIVDKREEESAFGEASVKEYTRNVREWVITGTSKPEAMYEVGDEQNGITADEVKKAMADREVYLADVKKRQEEYQAQRAAANSGTNENAGSAGVSAAAGGFNF